jgi:hypothetical protein
MTYVMDQLNKIHKDQDEMVKVHDQIRNEIIKLYEERAKASSGVVEFLADHKIKALQVDYDSNIKSVDVFIDILKFAIPIDFSVWGASFTLKQLSQANNLLLIILLGLIALIVILIIVRHLITREYVKDYKRIYETMANRYIVSLDSKNIADKMQLEELKKRIKQTKDLVDEHMVILEKIPK